MISQANTDIQATEVQIPQTGTYRIDPEASTITFATLLSGGTQAARPGEAEPLLEPLSKTELRVLRYLPTSLQGPEIASELFVSVNTIRTHMRHLYAKLGVHRRAAAVERARALGLLGATSRRH